MKELGKRELRHRLLPASLIAAALVLACLLRMDDLDRHPLHADEAVQATKFATYLETGTFDYDPREYHGPLPHYISRVVLGRCGRPAPDGGDSIDESDLRLAPALIGVVVVGLVGWLACMTWGGGAAWGAMLLAAASSSLVFFSRYYIAEMFLVAATCLFLGAVCRLLQDHGEAAGGGSRGASAPWWAVLAGVAAGMMHATKETCVLSFAAVGIAGLVTFGLDRRRLRLLLVMVVVALLTSATLYSGGFRHLSDIGESMTTYLRYLGRAGGEEGHAQPWWFYLQRYGWFRGGYLWSELGVFVLAGAGFLVACLQRKRPGIFLGVYATCLAAIYCVIPYKTPWSFLPAFIALFPLAGCLFAPARGRVSWIVSLVVVLAVAGHLGVQARRATHRMPTDPRNPYAYVHTSPDALSLVAMINELDRLAGAVEPLRLVVADPWMAWPLPWYLRHRSSVYYRDSFPAAPTSPILLAARTVLPEQGAGPAWQGYHRKMFGLRADQPLVLFVEDGLWQALLGARGMGEQEADAVADAPVD